MIRTFLLYFSSITMFLAGSCHPLLSVALIRRCVGQGVFRGTGKQTYGAVIALVGYYAVAIPVAFTLANKAKLGLKGMCKSCSGAA